MKDVVEHYTAIDLRELAPEIRWVSRKQCAITARGLGMLKEYSTSLPTGQADGKVWKRCGYGRSRWVLGEYVDTGDPKRIGIRWRELLVAL